MPDYKMPFAHLYSSTVVVTPSKLQIMEKQMEGSPMLIQKEPVSSEESQNHRIVGDGWDL